MTDAHASDRAHGRDPEASEPSASGPDASGPNASGPNELDANGSGRHGSGPHGLAPQTVWLLAGILIVAAAVRALRWQGVAVMFNDGPIFLALAKAIAAGSAEQALSHPFHPLYSALVALVHVVVEHWETAAVLTSVGCGTLAVGMLFLFVRGAHGTQAGLVAATLFAVHPGAIEYTGDIQSEGAYLLCFLASAVALWRGVRQDRPALALVGGALSGLAYLARPEGVGLALAVGALCGFEALRRRISWPRAIALGTAIGVGATLVALPYVLFLRVQLGEWTLTQKKSMAVMAGLEAPPREGPEPIIPSISRAGRPAKQRVAPRQLPGHPAAALSSKPERTRGEKLREAFFDVSRTHLRALRYESALFLVAAALLFGLRPVGFRGRFIAAIVGTYAVVLYALAANVGYVSGRHALPAVLLLLGYVAEGVLGVAARLTRNRGEMARRAAVALFLVVFAGIGLGKALRPDRTDSAAERRAAEWLAAQDVEVRGLAARKRRIAYYAQSPHVKIHRLTDSPHRLWVHGASHVILSDDPDDYPALQKTIPDQALRLHRVTEPAPGATIYELQIPPRFKNPRYRKRNLEGEDLLEASRKVDEDANSEDSR